MGAAIENRKSKIENQDRSYAALARSLESDLIRHALRLCKGDFDWAKDLVQDAIIAGYPLYVEGRLSEERNMRAWFMRVVTTRFINQFNRKRKWESDTPVEDVGAERSMADPRGSPEEILDRSTFDEPLEAALGQLPDEQRLCVLLVDVEGLEYAEAASQLQIPVGTVRSRLARARLRLYTLLLPYAKSRGLA